MKFKAIEIPSQKIQDTFWARIEKTEQCWLWMGQRVTGYGVFQIGRKNFRAHRLSYTILRGPIPEGLTLDHLCRNRICVNPDHLEPLALRDNILRGDGMAKAYRTNICCHGHDLLAHGYIRGDGKRCCRICVRKNKKEWKAKHAMGAGK